MASRAYDQRVRAVRQRLAFDFEPLSDTLSRGLDVLLEPEAAVLCTASIEALCDALFQVVLKNLHDDAAASLAPLDTKVTVYHLHVALRSHADFAALVTRVDSAAAVLECFLDDTTSRALYERHLLATPDAKHLRPSPSTDGTGDDDDDALARHARTRSEWHKRDDDPFSDVDFAAVLKCVHPACTLTHGAALLLGALVRELLNAVCDMCDLDRIHQRVPPELYVEDLAAPLARVLHVGDTGRAVDRTARECLERFRLRSQQGAVVTLRWRVFASSAAARATCYALPPVTRDTAMATIHLQMCKKCRVESAAYVSVYRGHSVDGAATPRALAMPNGAVVYLVQKTWWDHMRRNDARRGLLLDTRVRSGSDGGLFIDRHDVGRQATKPMLHAASASRLEGVGMQQSIDNDDDSLTRLLRARGGNQSTARDADAASDILTTMATQSAALVETLDAAWLGFASLSASVRALDAALQTRNVRDALDGAALRNRMEKTATLVRQTTAAHALMAQLLDGTKRWQTSRGDQDRR